MTVKLFEKNLNELFVSEDAKLTESEVNGKKYRIVEGTAAKGNIINRNKRHYGTPVYENTLRNYVSQKLQANKYLGELEHPEETRTSLQRAAVKFTDVWMEGDLVKYKGIILPTPAGKILEGLLEAEVAIGVSTRGHGSYKLVEMDGQDIEDIQNDYVMTGIDFVLDESNPFGSVNRFESTQGGNLDMEIKNLEQLKAHFPEFTKQLEESVKEATETAVKAELEDAHKTALAEAKVEAVDEYKKSEEATKFEKAFNSMVEAMKPHLPETVRIAESELGQKVTSLQESVTTTEAQLKAEKTARKLAEDELAELKGKEKVANLVESKVKDHKFETQLRTRLAECKTEEEVNAQFDKEVRFLESVFANAPENTPAGTGTVEGNEGGLNEGNTSTQTNTQGTLNEAQSKMALLAGLGKKK